MMTIDQKLVKIDSSYLDLLEKQVKEIDESLKKHNLHVTYIKNIDPDEWDKLVIPTSHSKISISSPNRDEWLTFKIGKKEVILHCAYLTVRHGKGGHEKPYPTFEIEKIKES